VIRVDLSGKTVLVTVALGAIAERIARGLADAGTILNGPGGEQRFVL